MEKRKFKLLDKIRTADIFLLFIAWILFCLAVGGCFLLYDIWSTVNMSTLGQVTESIMKVIAVLVLTFVMSIQTFLMAFE